MEQPLSKYNVSVLWRGTKYTVEISPDSTLRDLGQKLLKLTEVKADTMRLIVPQISSKSSKMLLPFSEEDGFINLQTISIPEDKTIRMMGVSKDEVDEVLHNAKKNERIAGFDEEERKLKQRMSNNPQASLRLPEGPYTFCEFRTLQIPGIELYPPASEALRRMHMLAADPGIIAIMNKHHWRVGIMTEMAPVGYVGVSPKCILGFNKNHGEEISLRLRTDDLKGFRKYDSIKKTLLHELAHMVYSEHDANFYALDKQLNEEAATLDWTRSKGYILNGVGHSQNYEENYDVQDDIKFSQKLGGSMSHQLASARASSVAAAYYRLAHDSASSSSVSKESEESDPDDSSNNQNRLEPDPDESSNHKNKFEHDPDNSFDHQNKFEPDPDECSNYENMFKSNADDSSKYQNKLEPDPDKSINYQRKLEPNPSDGSIYKNKSEPDPNDNSDYEMKLEPDPDDSSQEMQILEGKIFRRMLNGEPDPDDLGDKQNAMGCETASRSNEAVGLQTELTKDQTDLGSDCRKCETDDSRGNGPMQIEPELADNLAHQVELSKMLMDEPDPDDQEIQRIQDSVSLICNRLQEAIAKLLAEVRPSESSTVFQTLFKIVKNVIEHPDDMKYRRLRKANPLIQKNVVNYKGALEILFLIGFIEDVVLNGIGNTEAFLVLKRNDPGLLWLAKSTLERCSAS